MSPKTSRLLAAASLLVMAAAVPARAQSVSEERVREIVLEEIRKNPALIIESLDAYMQQQKTAEAAQAEQLVISKKADISALEGYPFVGNEDGKVELVYFFDVNCGYCKRLDPILKQVVAENPDVKVWHRELPILAESSRLGAYLEGLVWETRPDAYSGFHDSLMGHQGSLTQADVETKLAEAVGAAEAERLLAAVDQLDSDPAARKVNNRVQENLSIARAAGITGTPFVFAIQGDGTMRGAGADSLEQVNALIARARESN